MKTEIEKNKNFFFQKSVNLTWDMEDHFNYAIKSFSRVIYGERFFFELKAAEKNFFLLIYWMVNGSLDLHHDVLFPLLLFQFLFESRYGLWGERIKKSYGIHSIKRSFDVLNASVDGPYMVIWTAY